MKGDESSLLVVDDNEVNRDLLARRLQRQGHLVTVAEDGFQVRSMMRSKPFDLFLLDIMMPQINGSQVLEHLKADEKLDQISAVDDIDSIVRCEEKSERLLGKEETNG